MRKNRIKRTIGLSILLAIIVFAGVMLVYSLFFSKDLREHFTFGFVQSETVFIVLILASLLPILLFSLAIWLFKTRKSVVAEPLEDMSASQENENQWQVEAPEPEEAREEPVRFGMLTKLDEEMSARPMPYYDDKITLEELCERFRNYSANQLGLYYDISSIRQFIAGLSVTHIMIMQGMSGTGKTSLAFAFGQFLRNPSTIVPIQPMWKERTDLLGYYNEFTKKFNETQLLQKMYEANYSKDIYVTVLDEMNIARVEYYFAEFLSLLEIPDARGRQLHIIADEKENDPKLLHKGMMQLPDNMWFIGTANNDDSTFAISDKVYDRAMVINLDKKCEAFEAPPTEGLRLSIDRFKKLVEEARKEYAVTRRNRRRIAKLDKYLAEHFRVSFGNRIMKQIHTYVPVYLACGGEELDAIDDILAKKVLRKLEALNPIYVRNSAEGLRNYLDELFGQDRMKVCKDYLEHLERTV